MLWKKLVIISLIIQITKSACPNGCICNYASVDCSSRQLTAIPNDLPSEIFHDGTIDKPLLPGIKTFTHLNFANNLLEELPTSLFSDKLPFLMSLDLSNNKIHEITNVQSVVLAKKLLYLKLSSNPIRNLGFSTETVLYSQSISHLDVSECDINSITNPASLMYLMNLTKLDISGNPLVVIDHLESTTISHLDLSRCLLGFTDKGIREESFKHLPKLQFLNLSMNAHLTRFPVSKLSSSLLYLEASYCAFEKLDLRSFPNLQQALLKGNVVKALYSGMLSDNIYLQYLDVSENSIHYIENQAFLGVKTLRKLDLSMNLLSEINWNVFKHTTELQVLNISKNLFTSLDEISVSSLVTLDVSKCDIIKLGPKFLAKTQNLKNLNLSHNSMEKLPRRLTSNKLLNLDLSFCRISELQDDTFQESSSLLSLNLMGNRLTNPIKESLLHHLENMRELNLLNNPWYCDCNDSDFKKLWIYLSSYPKKTSNFKNLICHSPKEFSGMPWEIHCFENSTDKQKSSKNGAWFSFLVPFLTLSCLLAILVVIRQAYTFHALELQREPTNQGLSSHNRTTPPRVAPHTFDEDFERGIQLSVNESTQRSPIQELSKLPSYEEALLLPKLLNREDLQNIIRKYEHDERFEQSVLEDLRVQPQCSTQHNEDSASTDS